MERNQSTRLKGRILLVVIGLALAGAVFSIVHVLNAGSALAAGEASIPNNQPFQNQNGKSATFSTQGQVDLTGEFFQAQGTNGRSCASCHIAENAWAINPSTLQEIFDETDGTDPVFNLLDADNPNMDVSTTEARLAAYSMLLRYGVFRRGGAPRPNSEWELIAVDDPHGFANLNRLVQWRRAMPSANFALGSATINWDGGNSVGTDQHAGLVNQASRNVTGGQQGSPAPPEVIDDIVAFEESLSSAQIIVPGVGRLDAGNARGGPEALSKMSKTAGRFDLFDVWIGDSNRLRAQIARGQEIFNGVNANGRSCNGCHSSANNGTNINNAMFDIGTSSAEERTADLPLYTFRNRSTGEIRQLTDTGRGNVTGLWNDLARFKTPSLRALSARAPYFHNGIAATLEDVVRHYERHLGFVFTDQERADLVAFLGAL
jgi:cytochrome c peroxidase